MSESKRIPIAAAKHIADEFGKDQVIVVTWDKTTGTTWVTTYGKTVDECTQAAEGGNRVKRALGWPESLCSAKPARAKRKVLALDPRLVELLDRVTGTPGPVSSALSASEWHELRDEVEALKKVLS